ncbi:hypothetical protein PsorP6_006381 [Peronosclerospora sorghi]|uniref:Uncharacterized protein n=1 Tax=Peronosclerospora sorghi TaxID=230839 RepID=A0ACC0W4V5_9STRA|nr:hypothetical protein PsorP6_006381 [Peronosclerospora sorghi]
MDCQYRKKQFRISLLKDIGCSPRKKTFFYCFTMLRKEKLSDHDWALARVVNIYKVSEKPVVIVADTYLA